MRKLKSLTEIASAIYPIQRKIPSINCGGCGIFAVALAKELTRLGYKVKIITLEQSHYSPVFIKKQFKSEITNLRYSRKNNKQPKNGGAAHYMVKMGNYAIDCNGEFLIYTHNNIKVVEKGYIDYIVAGTISIDDLEYLNGFSWAWNDTFPRRKYGEEIKRLVKKYIQKLHN